MDWIHRLNEAVGYIDRHLDGEIDFAEITRITLTPIGLFQRYFMLTAGVTLAEYIRRRKLTRALQELRDGTRVTDVSFRYGWDSSDAFAVAFKRLYGVTPSQARQKDLNLKSYDRVFFNLKITYIKGERDMVLLNIDRYRYYGPLFEAARIALTYLDEKYSPEYIQGISGAAFKISGGCPSRPTCACDMWPADLLQKLGFDVTTYPCVNDQGNDIADYNVIETVKKQIDAGKPALVWHAFSNEEWDIVCGYDDEAKQFIGRGFLAGNGDDYARESWDRPKTSGVYGFGAIIIGAKINEAVDLKALEIESLKNAVKHAKTISDEAAKAELAAGGFKYQNIDGIAFYNEWADYYSNEGADRDMADAYCLDIYSSVRKAAPLYLKEIAAHFNAQAAKYLLEAADAFSREAEVLAELWPLLTWSSPWGVDEERSKKAAPIIREAAGHYEQAVDLIEKALEKAD